MTSLLKTFTMVLQLVHLLNVALVASSLSSLEHVVNGRLGYYDDTAASVSASALPLVMDDANVERKYVNGGQSVVLICDLPNSQPDGKVSSIEYVCPFLCILLIVA